MNTALVICIGNVARGDDGVAHSVAELLGSQPPAGTILTVAVDLDVAMARDVAETGLLLIVDAERRSEPAVRVEPIPRGVSGRATGHGMDAPTLLALASSLYGSEPDEALVVSVAAPEMGHDEGLSPIAEAASREAASIVARLIGTRRSE